MANIPQTGTYLSQDNHFKIQIDSADPTNGQITGMYETTESPEGPFVSQGTVGHYSWVNNAQGQSGVAPFNISFNGSIRPNGWPYCIVDSWDGAYEMDNTLLLAGTRAYVNSKGGVEVASLGTQKFSK
ncbi:MAG TPA: hypothetical protein VGG20_07050 [Thermoanaerobaculia bacterium]|jgi:hypothetical protein